MACKTSCRLCPHLVISDAVTFANDTLTINIPAGAYQNGEKWGQSNFKPFSLFAISRATQTRTHTNTSLFVRTNIVLYVRTKANT